MAELEREMVESDAEMAKLPFQMAKFVRILSSWHRVGFSPEIVCRHKVTTSPRGNRFLSALTVTKHLSRAAVGSSSEFSLFAIYGIHFDFSPKVG